MKKTLPKVFSLFLILALVLGALPVQMAQAATPTELFFSEYIEGSSNNKALEIYNGTGSAIDLAAGSYIIQMYFNGVATVGTSISLTGTVASGDVFVVAQSLAVSAILSQADQVSSASWYNGDDAIVLRKGGASGTILDVLGQIGFDPGTEWGTGLVSTADNTLRRKSNICQGDTNGSDAFDPSIEWDGYATDTFDGLGSHTANCDETSDPTGVGLADPNTVSAGDPTLLTVAVTPGANPTSTGLAASCDLTAIGGSLTQSFYDDNTNGDVTAGDNIFSFLATVDSGTSAGAKNMPCTITDAEARSGNASISLTVQAAQSSAAVVISQVYGGGGNTSAPYKNDFIELYNRSSAPVDLTGWSVQYGSSGGTTWTNKTDLSGVIQPGNYYLIQEAAGTSCSGGPCGVDLPTPNASGSINMSGSAGKVALVSSTTALTGSGCPFAATVVDFVGYGSANCSETSPTAVLSNTTAAIRKFAGAQDTDNNSVDFEVGAPNPRNTPPPPPALSIDDVSFFEGNSETRAFAFTVSLSAPAGAGGVTFDIATADGTANSPDDFTAVSLPGQTIPEGISTYTFDVSVNGDTTDEPDETFFVNVTNVTGADVVDNQGQGDIINDDGDFCSLAGTPIYSIQGSGPSAAITGNVTTRGVVVGDFEGPTGLLGFYLQDASGDGDPATSDGIFVFTGGADTVSVGDLVKVRGFARERFNQTAINGSNDNNSAVLAGNIADCGTGSVAPVEVTLPFASATFPERYEGMLVRLPQSLVISEYFNYERFGELVLAMPLDGETRPFTGTAIDEPGAPANARTLANSLRRITLDDGLGIQNPDFVRHPNGNAFSLDNRFRGGDKVANTVGVLGFDFSLYRIQPTGPADYIPVNPRPEAPADVGGNLRVAAMNTLNFFITPNYPTGDPLDNTCGPAQNVECRGHDSDQPDEFTRQRTKLLAALAGLDADVIGLNEIENTTGVDPLGDPVKGIVAGLNDIFGPGTYASIDTGVIGTDAIRVGLIYRPAVVTPVGDFKILDSSVDPRFIDTRSRPVLAQTFEEVATGARFTVAVNHLKSKGSACAGDPDMNDGQGNCNQTRKAAAEALVDWLATDPTGSGDPDFLIIGDLNSYAREDPITAIKNGPDGIPGTGDDYVNLIAKYQGTYAYSYVFDGQFGYLDHALANSSLARQVTGAADWHINADEPDLLDYDTTFKPPAQDAIYEPNAYRSSDHDPVVIGLKLRYFTGFFPPIQNLPVFNVVKAGQGIPVKFSLNGDQGLNIFAAGYPKSEVIACNATDPTSGVDETVTSGSSSLSYNPLTDTYTYVWKTNKSWANTCRQLIIKLDDGTIHLANFQFTK